jgi:predicted MFS family arabinose efflux permease
MPVFIVDIYHLGPDSMGLLVAIMGGGSLVGSLLIASTGAWKRGLLLILGSLASGIALLLIALIPLYSAAAVIMILLGLGDSSRRTLNQSLIMEEVDDAYRGRVMSIFMMNFGLTPFGVLPAGIVSDWLGGQWAIGMLAVLLLVVSVVVWATQKRLREID